MRISKTSFLILAGVVITSSNTFAAKAPKADQAELGAVIYKYDMGDVVAVSVQPNQHVICDTCPKTMLLAGYKEPVVSRLKLNGIEVPQPSEVDSGDKPLVVPTVKVAQSAASVAETASEKPLATIQFKLNSSKLDKTSIAEIRRVAKELKQQSESGEVFVKVSGYTCRLGTKKYNDKLAVARARSVANNLRLQGIKVTRTSGEGVCCFVDNKHLEPNRRAEIEKTKGVQK